MRKITLTSCFTFVLALAAVAGPIAMEKNVAPVPPPCTWTGFYVGINGGVGWQKSRFVDQNYGGYEGAYYAPGATADWDNINYQAGGQVGFNYQWKDLVFGIEADADYSGNSINKTRLVTDSSDIENWGWYDRARIDFQGTVRGRVGISLLDNKALVYGTAGAAFVHGDWNEHFAYFTTDESGYYDRNWKGDDWRWGFVAGMGLEYKLNCHWSIKGEGLYTWLAEDVQTPNQQGGYFTFRDAKWVFADEMFEARVGLNYAFAGFFGH